MLKSVHTTTNLHLNPDFHCWEGLLVRSAQGHTSRVIEQGPLPEGYTIITDDPATEGVLLGRLRQIDPHAFVAPGPDKDNWVCVYTDRDGRIQTVFGASSGIAVAVALDAVLLIEGLHQSP